MPQLELHQAIYTRCRLRYKMCQNPISENINAYKNQRNKCVSLRRQCIKQHLAKITEKGITTKKGYWVHSQKQEKNHNR